MEDEEKKEHAKKILDLLAKEKITANDSLEVLRVAAYTINHEVWSITLKEDIIIPEDLTYVNDVNIL